MITHSAPGWRAAPGIGLDRKCVVCGRSLTVQQALSGDVCDELACKGPYLQRLNAAAMAARRTERSRLAEEVSRCVGVTGPLAVVVPANLNDCVPLSPERLEAFRTHLRRVIAAAEPPHETAAGDTGTAELPPNVNPPDARIAHGCATCRGRCCLQGAGHAFLRAETITEFWQRHPAMSADAIETEYLNHVAPRGFADSCVYHSESGCTLPRDMRGDVCNTFLCEELLQGLDEPLSPSLYITADGREIHRVVLVEADGRRSNLLPK